MVPLHTAQAGKSLLQKELFTTSTTCGCDRAEVTCSPHKGTRKRSNQHTLVSATSQFAILCYERTDCSLASGLVLISCGMRPLNLKKDRKSQQKSEQKFDGATRK